MPQKEKGYTPIANEIMDALCKTRIAGEQRQILDCIFRKTYGWNKKEDRISLSQFMDATKIGKTHIIRAINGLLEKNMITKKGNDFGVTYSIQKNYHKWNSLPKKVTLPKMVMSVTKNGNLALPKMVHTKDTITKDTITKDIKPLAKFYKGIDEDLIKELLDFNQEHIKDWFTARGKKTLTPTAFKMLKTEALKAKISTAEAIKECAGNGWQGFKASYLENTNIRKQNYEPKKIDWANS